MGRLQEAFNKKTENYMLPFFWQHGEDENTLREYMEVIYRANMRAVCVESRPHPDFCGAKWWHDMDIILEEAKRLGMKLWILDDSHFPTGFANGAMENAPDYLRHQYMVYRTLEMSGPATGLTLEVAQYQKPAPKPPWMSPKQTAVKQYEDDELVKIIACPVEKGEALGSPVDLTEQIKDGILEFDLEDGYYRIFVIYLTRNADGRNDYINFLDKDSCKLLLDAVYEPHYEHYHEYFGNVIAGFFSDEPPIGNVEGYQPAGPIGTGEQNLPWSRYAEKKMAECYGSEDWKQYIPYLWAEASDREIQAKIRTAYMNMVSLLVEENFSKQNGDWCNAHGVEYIGHMLEDCDMNSDMGASMGHFFRGLSGQHMAGIDNIGGQVMINGQDAMRHKRPACEDEAGFYHYLLGKLGASHGAIDPKKRGRCLCENFGAYGWQSGTKEQKFLLDHFMVRGVNHFVPHAFSPAPFPDPDCPPHFYAHGENPLYRAFGELMAYGNRVCHLIHGGKACPDVALLYPAESKWAGDKVSNIRAARYLTQKQIDFHVIPADVFDINSEYPWNLEDNTLTINKISYQALVVSGCDFVEKQAAEFMQRAVLAGFPVIFTDQKPTKIIAADEQANIEFAEGIAPCPVYPVEELGERLFDMIVAQVSLKPENKKIVTYHYRGDEDIYLLLNEMAKESYCGQISVLCEGIPLRYYPWENRMEQISYETMENGQVNLSLLISPLELCIIVFKKEISEPMPAPALLFEKEELELNKLRVKAVDAKEYANYIEKTERDGQIINAPFTGMQRQYPDFSGYYIYDTQLTLTKGCTYRLMLEHVSESAELFLNGESLGMRVQPPFAFILPESQILETNEIRIEVATLLERKLYAAGGELRAMSPDRPLSPTGILGKVVLQRAK